MSLYDMQSWATSTFPNGKWENSQKTNWLISSPFREDKHPSFSIDIEKRCTLDRGTGEAMKLSDFCQKLGIDEPDRKGGSLPPRTQEPIINRNAMIALDRWKKAQQADDNFPYLLRKGVPSYGLRTDSDTKMGQVILIPALDANNQIVGLERINAEGQKQHLGEKKNTFYLIGEPGPGEQVYIAEGYATACSIHQIKAQPVAVSFSSFNLPNVAKIMRDSGYLPIICPDSGASEVTGFRNIKTPDGTPDKADWNDLHQEHGLDEARRVFREQEAKSTEAIPPARTRRIIRYNELKFKEPDFLIDDILESGALVSVYGATGSYKTYFVLDMLLSVAKGIPFHNREVKQTPAFYICAEGQAGIKSRVMAWCTGRGYSTEEDIPDFYYYGDPISLPEEEDVIMSLIDEAIKGYKTNTPGLLAIDTLARTFSGDENSNTDMGAYIRVMDKIKAKYPGITILLVHHTGHGDQTRGRGASALKCALDCEMGVKRTDSTAIISNTKMKNAECFKDLYFNAILETVGYNHKKNKPITDLYLEETEGGILTKGKNKLSATDQTGIDSYHEAMQEAIRVKVANGDIKNIHEGIHLDEWRTTYYRRSTAETQGAKETAFRRARKNLVSYRMLEVDDDYYKLYGETHIQTASAYFLACKGELDRQADIPRHVADMSEDIQPDRHRHTPVGVSDVGDVGVEKKGISTSCGSPIELEEIIIDVSFNRQEYSEAEAQSWLDSEAPPEARTLYQKKFENMVKTMTEETSRGLALKRTWEKLHTARENRG